MAWIAGVDGCPGGWIAVLMDLDGAAPPCVRVVPRLSEIVDASEAPIVAVDMPIGLPERIEGPGRAAEQAVRSLLGQRQSSVFSIPSREAVYAPDYRESCAVALATSAPPRKVSRQGFMLFPKVREIDGLLRTRPELAARVFEVHPEVAFWSLNGERPLSEPKKVKGRPHEAGLAERRRLLVGAGLPAVLVEAEAPRAPAPTTTSTRSPPSSWRGRSRAATADRSRTRRRRIRTACRSRSGPFSGPSKTSAKRPPLILSGSPTELLLHEGPFSR